MHTHTHLGFFVVVVVVGFVKVITAIIQHTPFCSFVLLSEYMYAFATIPR